MANIPVERQTNVKYRRHQRISPLLHLESNFFPSAKKLPLK